MMKWPWIALRAGLALALASLDILSARGDSGAPDLKRLERSFSVHASLASQIESDRWSTNFPLVSAPTDLEIRNAARLLTDEYAANRLYLVYHKELSLIETETAFRVWRLVCAPEVELVPTLVLRNGQTNHAELFTTNELRSLISFFKKEVNPRRLAVLNVGSNANEMVALRVLAAEYPGGLINAGLKPDEPLAEPFSGAVENAEAALCEGKANDDWQQAGSGRGTLNKCVQSRNENSLPVAWNLGVIVAGDSGKTMVLPSGRNTIAATEILHFATPALIAGFSADLQHLQCDSRSLAHDGLSYSFYEMLKRGNVYVGYYARPFHEVVKTYKTLRSGKSPGH
jgi:hypothetical protein